MRLLFGASQGWVFLILSTQPDILASFLLSREDNQEKYLVTSTVICRANRYINCWPAWLYNVFTLTTWLRFEKQSSNFLWINIRLAWRSVSDPSVSRCQCANRPVIISASLYTRYIIAKSSNSHARCTFQRVFVQTNLHLFLYTSQTKNSIFFILQGNQHFRFILFINRQN